MCKTICGKCLGAMADASNRGYIGHFQEAVATVLEKGSLEIDPGIHFSARLAVTISNGNALCAWHAISGPYGP